MVSGKRLFWPNINERCHTLFYWPAKFHWHSPLISRNQLKMTNFQNIPVIRVLPWNISSNCLNLKIQNFTWLHLFHFSPQCIIKCVPKALAWEDAKSHRLHLFVFSPLLCTVCFQMSSEMVWKEKALFWDAEVEVEDAPLPLVRLPSLTEADPVPLFNSAQVLGLENS